MANSLNYVCEPEVSQEIPPHNVGTINVTFFLLGNLRGCPKVSVSF